MLKVEQVKEQDMKVIGETVEEVLANEQEVQLIQDNE
jgi:hypothetical protein